ncbi:hypothetical protein MKZ38_009360 [Zalerion maritima]|uniref:Cerato-platanin n=1 Tax=Zalerion maritima TaxID=339359 RepID=A0AAD5RUM0_9PEZI|nr:hypothetical protein MKZ38_009360 [Zalerion maritima]
MLLATTLFSLSLFRAVVAGVVRRGNTISVTPHDSYQSSAGVLGCYINTNRVAYWPSSPDCNDICVKLTYGDRSLHVLKIDISMGAYDISYDAWNELVYGESAHDSPHAGGGEPMEYEFVDMEHCEDLILTEDKKLPFVGMNGMSFVGPCLEKGDNYVSRNYVFYNIADAVCTLGVEERCRLDPGFNTPNCTTDSNDQNGVYGFSQEPLEAENPVINIRYPDGTFADALGNAVLVDEAQTSGASPTGGTFKESDTSGDNSTSIIQPFQALVMLGALLKNAFKDA